MAAPILAYCCGTRNVAAEAAEIGISTVTDDRIKNGSPGFMVHSPPWHCAPARHRRSIDNGQPSQANPVPHKAQPNALALFAPSLWPDQRTPLWRLPAPQADESPIPDTFSEVRGTPRNAG